jgi:uncharacterized protein involved in exopolysaccharide biosynthesis
MPDLLLVFVKRWKLILIITFLATLIAFLFALLSPKKYLSVATALPVNSVTADKARMFSQNIEALYSDFGTADELDRLEGTAALDTIFIDASKELGLPAHYSLPAVGEGPYKAAMDLKKNTKINRSSYGELKVKVWDEDRNEAAVLSNFLMQKLQELHQHLQNQRNVSVLEKIKEEYDLKQKEYLQLADSLEKQIDTSVGFELARKEISKTKLTALAEQLQQYEKMIGEYQLAASTNAPVLLVVENARPPLWPDKPKVVPTVLVTFFGAFLFSYLIALFIEGRKYLV